MQCPEVHLMTKYQTYTAKIASVPMETTTKHQQVPVFQLQRPAEIICCVH